MKVALITGGTDGIGYATARHLLLLNWEVVIIGRNPSKCNASVQQLKSETGNENISSITADLSLMKETIEACNQFVQKHQTLDLLFLNANALLQKRLITHEGHEWHFALGYLSRALMALKLESLLSVTPNSQILSVVGLNTSPLDFSDLTISKAFSTSKALGRFQWALHLFNKAFDKWSDVPINLYMPGLVKTKILMNQPWPLRFIIKIANALIGITPEASATHILHVIQEVSETKNSSFLYRVNKRTISTLATQSGTASLELWEITHQLLTPFL